MSENVEILENGELPEEEMNDVSGQMEILTIKMEPSVFDISETQPFEVDDQMEVNNIQVEQLTEVIGDKRCSNSSNEARSIIISHTLDDYYINDKNLVKNNIIRSNSCDTDGKDSFVSAQSNAIDLMEHNSILNDNNNNNNDKVSNSFMKNFLDCGNLEKAEEELEEFIIKLMCL